MGQPEPAVSSGHSAVDVQAVGTKVTTPAESVRCATARPRRLRRREVRRRRDSQLPGSRPLATAAVRSLRRALDPGISWATNDADLDPLAARLAGACRGGRRGRGHPAGPAAARPVGRGCGTGGTRAGLAECPMWPGASSRRTRPTRSRPFVARLIPTDANGPGATEARGAVHYIDRALGGALVVLTPGVSAGFAAFDRLLPDDTEGRRLSSLSATDRVRVLIDVESGSATGSGAGLRRELPAVLRHGPEPYEGEGAPSAILTTAATPTTWAGIFWATPASGPTWQTADQQAMEERANPLKHQP